VRARHRTRAAALLACAAGLTGLLPAARAADLPGFADVRAAHRPSDVPLLARDGTVLGSVRRDPLVCRGPWVALEDVSPALRHALVLGEDRRFWDHGGIDWPALAASAWRHAWNGHTRGASTLSMQLAGLLDHELARPAGGRSLGTKVSQMVRAREIESRWSKAQILEAYLNRVPLRGELVGVAAASQQLFGKHASGLDGLESALLAALVRAPNADATAVERRACALLQLQGQPCTGLATRVQQALQRRHGPALGEQAAPHLAQRLLRGSAPDAPALRSTLDATLQRQAAQALRRQLAELRGRNVEDGAVLVLDNASGEVLAWVGSAGALASAPEVDAVTARRQPGSTLKPLVYALALQRRLVTAASPLDDSPLQLDAGGALYQPQNYDHRWRGAVPLRQALAGSLNVPAVRVATMLGPQAVFDGLDAFGLRLQHDAGFHGHALALGAADVTLLDLANAYRTLARGGLLTPVRWQAASSPSPVAAPAAAPAAAAARRVVPAAVAWLVADMLADPAARAPTFGLDSALVTRGWAAVKTGTSKDLRDNWCLGFTPRHTVAVWVGNASGAPMHGVSGVSGAAPVWRELVLALQARETAAAAHAAPAAPPGLVRQGGEWFLVGTEPATSGAAAAAPAAAGRLGIVQPAAGSVVVLDPEIPLRAQRLVFEAATADGSGRWWLNGQPLGHTARLAWLPRPGRHVLEWRTAAGRDRVDFEVRAAPPPRRVAAIRPPNG
jgi:penicillin-binding protein 1C